MEVSLTPDPIGDSLATIDDKVVESKVTIEMDPMPISISPKLDDSSSHACYKDQLIANLQSQKRKIEEELQMYSNLSCGLSKILKKESTKPSTLAPSESGLPENLHVRTDPAETTALGASECGLPENLPASQ